MGVAGWSVRRPWVPLWPPCCQATLPSLFPSHPVLHNNHKRGDQSTGARCGRNQRLMRRRLPQPQPQPERQGRAPPRAPPTIPPSGFLSPRLLSVSLRNGGTVTGSRQEQSGTEGRGRVRVKGRARAPRGHARGSAHLCIAKMAASVAGGRAGSFGSSSSSSPGLSSGYEVSSFNATNGGGGGAGADPRAGGDEDDGQNLW